MEEVNLNVSFKIGFNIILLYNLQGYVSYVGSTDILNELTGSLASPLGRELAL